MIMSILLIVGMVQSAGIVADARPPSASALALARLVSHGEPAAERLAKTAEGVTHRLLNTFTRRGAGCDPKVPSCLAAAQRIAREQAPIILAANKEARDEWRAIIMDETMTASEIAAATVFVATPAGRSFARALTLLEAPGDASPTLQRRLAIAMMKGRPSPEQGMFDRFYDLTVDLPRRSLPLVPPPPQPSPSPAAKP